MATSLTLKIPEYLQERLTREAQHLGMSIEQYASRLLGAEPETKKSVMTGAEVVDFWKREGLIGSREDIDDSQSHARRIRHEAERRRHRRP